MEHERHTDWYAYQKAALKALCPYLGDSPASPLEPDAAHTQPNGRASAPGGGDGQRSAQRRCMKPAACGFRVFSDFYASHVSSPFAPVLNATKVAKGLQRKRPPGRPPSLKTQSGSLCEPLKHLATPGKASVSLWDAATHAHRGTALLGESPRRPCPVCRYSTRLRPHSPHSLVVLSFLFMAQSYLFCIELTRRKPLLFCPSTRFIFLAGPSRTPSRR
jgi:hypothetical protein